MRNNLRALLNHNTPELPSELIERLALQSSPKAHEFRTNAWQQAQNLPFPDKKDEAWRRINLDALLQTPLNLFTAERRTDEDGDKIPAKKAAVYAGCLYSSPSGSHLALDPKLAQSGLVLCDYNEAEKKNPDFIAQYSGKIVPPTDGKFAAAALGLAEYGLVLRVPRSLRAEQPLYARLDAGTSGSAAFSHSLIHLEAGASAVLVLDYRSSSAMGSAKNRLHLGVLEVKLEAGAELTLVELQQFTPDVWNITHERAALESNARLHWVYGALGANLSKNFIEASLRGAGAETKMHGLFFASGQQVFDLDTQQDHLAAHTTSDLLYKGAAAGSARTIWEGMIYVAPEAMQTDGYQTNRNLMLSEAAEMNALPGLEILADDVRCSHGATIGRLDEDELFYLQTRGIPRAEAEQLVMEGFFGEVIEQVPVESLRAELKKVLNARFTLAVTP